MEIEYVLGTNPDEVMYRIEDEVLKLIDFAPPTPDTMHTVDYVFPLLSSGYTQP